MSPKAICLSMLGISTTAVGGYYVINSTITKELPKKEAKKITSKSLREDLASKNPLNTKENTDDSSWATLVTKHLEPETNKDKKIKLAEEFKVPNSDENNATNVGILKKACEALLVKTENYENDKEIAEIWCTKESELLKSK